MLFYEYEQDMLPDNRTKYEQITTFFSEISHQTLYIYRKNDHNYLNFAQSQILLYMHQRSIVPDHSAQYEENPSIHHGGMYEDRHPDGLINRLTDGWTDGLNPFLYSLIPFRWSRE